MAVCWQQLNFAKNSSDSSVVSDAKLDHLSNFVRMLYSVMFEPSVKLDQIYPTRSLPMNSLEYRYR